VIRALTIAAAVLAGSIALQTAHAQELKEIEIERISGRAPFVPDPNKAYLLVETRNLRAATFTFVKAADGAGGADPANATGYIEIAGNHFANEDGVVSVRLFAVPPGEYFFSSLTWQWLPVDVDCACMGTVRFPVELGKVTAIRVETAILDAKGEQIGVGNIGDAIPDGRHENDLFAMRGIAVGHPTSALLRGRVDDQYIEPARLAPVAELPNWFGRQINRVLPIPGVLDYEGDRMVDLRGRD